MNGSNGVLSAGRAQTYLGKMSAYRKADETVLRGTQPTTVTNPRTAAQMAQRLKMYSSAPLYNAIKEAIALGWENVPKGQSLYNRFTGLAMRSMPYGISKDLYDKGAALAWPAQITCGSLPTIAVNGQISSIVVKNLDEITASTTVSELAHAIVEGNPGIFEYDDEIAFIEVIQSIDSDGVPRLACSRSAVILDRDSQETLATIPSLKGFAVDGEHMAVKGTPAIGCFAWVHSRMQNGKLLVSTQHLVSNNDAILANFSDAVKLRAAAKSLGADLLSEKFLKPTNLEGRMALKIFDISASRIKGAKSAGEDGIVSVEYDGGFYIAGDTAPIMDCSTDNQLVVTVTDITKLGNTIQCKINGSPVTNPVKSGNTIKMTIPADQDANPLRTVVVLDPTHAWRLEF